MTTKEMFEQIEKEFEKSGIKEVNNFSLIFENTERIALVSAENQRPIITIGLLECGKTIANQELIKCK